MLTAMTWYGSTSPFDEDRVLGAWPDAPTENVELCEMLLGVARTQVMAFAAAEEAPALQVADLLDAIGIEEEAIAAVLALLEFPTNPAPPVRYVYAQLQQAKNLWNAGRASGDGEAGAEGFSFTPRPLDKTIRAIIRPRSGAADVL